MKYITFEKNEYHLKLFKDVKHKIISSFWIYETYQVECEISELPQEIQANAIEIPEEVARASWFSHIDLNQRRTINIKVEQGPFEWLKDSFKIPKNRVLLPRDKFTYHITDEDELNSVKYIKAILLHYVEKDFNSLTEKNKLRYTKKVQSIKESIEACKTNYDCHVIMHNHFGYAFIKVDPETKHGITEEGEKWDITKPVKQRKTLGPITEESLDSGPTIDTIDPSVFQLKWEVSEPVKIEL
jgi:hypothetical protein